MTLPDEEFSSATAPRHAVGRSSFVVQEPRQDVVRSARTTRDGDVVSSTNYVPVANREPGRDVLGREAGHVVRPEDRKPVVTDWTGPTDYDNAPPTYQACFEQYHSYIGFLVRNMGVHPREVEDVVADIEARFLERDSLGEFRNDWATRSTKGRSVFRSYLSRFVVTYARGMHRNKVRHAKRFPTICNAPVGDDNGTTWLDQYDADVEGVGRPQAEVEYEDFLASLAATVGPEIVEVVLSLVEEQKRVTLSSLRTALAARLGESVSQRQARTTLDRLREAATALS